MPVELLSPTPTASSSPAVNGVPPATEAEAEAQVISSDFETFLLMLTTQLENQDPLNPIESQDFAVQLATFSGVEQQVQTNDLLRDLTGALGAADIAQLAGWVGMEARVSAPVSFDGTPVDIAISPDAGSDQAQLVIRDALGQEVSREGVPATPGIFAWVGMDASGQPLAPGLYTLELASVRDGEVTSVQTVPHYARVEEARLGTDSVELVVAGGTVVSSSDVDALRAPTDGSQ